MNYFKKFDSMPTREKLSSLKIFVLKERKLIRNVFLNVTVM